MFPLKRPLARLDLDTVLGPNDSINAYETNLFAGLLFSNYFPITFKFVTGEINHKISRPVNLAAGNKFGYICLYHSIDKSQKK